MPCSASVAETPIFLPKVLIRIQAIYLGKKKRYRPSEPSAAASAAVGKSCRLRPRSPVGAGTAAHAFTGLCSREALADAPRESVDRADVDETNVGRFRTSAAPVGLTEGSG